MSHLVHWSPNPANPARAAHALDTYGPDVLRAHIKACAVSATGTMCAMSVWTINGHVAAALITPDNQIVPLDVTQNATTVHIGNPRNSTTAVRFLDEHLLSQVASGLFLEKAVVAQDGSCHISRTTQMPWDSPADGPTTIVQDTVIPPLMRDQTAKTNPTWSRLHHLQGELQASNAESDFVITTGTAATTDEIDVSARRLRSRLEAEILCLNADKQKLAHWSRVINVEPDVWPLIIQASTRHSEQLVEDTLRHACGPLSNNQNDGDDEGLLSAEMFDMALQTMMNIKAKKDHDSATLDDHGLDDVLEHYATSFMKEKMEEKMGAHAELMDTLFNTYNKTTKTTNKTFTDMEALHAALDKQMEERAVHEAKRVNAKRSYTDDMEERVRKKVDAHMLRQKEREAELNARMKAMEKRMQEKKPS